MSTLRKAVLLVVGVISFVLMWLSFAVVGITVLGVVSVLAVAGYLLRRATAVETDRPVIIDHDTGSPLA